MERKIGETFDCQGKKYIVEAGECWGCSFESPCSYRHIEYKRGDCEGPIDVTGLCSKRFRTDKQNVHFVEVEPEPPKRIELPKREPKPKKTAKPKETPKPKRGRPKKTISQIISTMEINDYQKRAMSTRMATCDNFAYMFLNLVGEVGELSSKVAKDIRKDKYFFSEGNQLLPTRNMGATEYTDKKNELALELGDILWMCAGLAECMGYKLEEIAQMNLDKLAARKSAGTIDGNGDGITKEERSHV